MFVGSPPLPSRHPSVGPQFRFRGQSVPRRAGGGERGSRAGRPRRRRSSGLVERRKVTSISDVQVLDHPRGISSPNSLNLRELGSRQGVSRKAALRDARAPSGMGTGSQRNGGDDQAEDGQWASGGLERESGACGSGERVGEDKGRPLSVLPLLAASAADAGVGGRDQVGQAKVLLPRSGRQRRHFVVTLVTR